MQFKFDWPSTQWLPLSLDGDSNSPGRDVAFTYGVEDVHIENTIVVEMCHSG